MSYGFFQVFFNVLSLKVCALLTVMPKVCNRKFENSLLPGLTTIVISVFGFFVRYYLKRTFSSDPGIG